MAIEHEYYKNNLAKYEEHKQKMRVRAKVQRDRTKKRLLELEELVESRKPC